MWSFGDILAHLSALVTFFLHSVQKIEKKFFFCVHLKKFKLSLHRWFLATQKFTKMFVKKLWVGVWKIKASRFRTCKVVKWLDKGRSMETKKYGQQGKNRTSSTVPKQISCKRFLGSTFQNVLHCLLIKHPDQKSISFFLPRNQFHWDQKQKQKKKRVDSFSILRGFWPAHIKPNIIWSTKSEDQT